MATSSASKPAYTPHKRPSFWQRLRSGNLSEGQLGWLLLLPALITLAVVMLYPVFNVLWQSLHFERLNQPFRGTPFIGLENFRDMLWGRDMGWDVTHLWGWRALLFAALVPLWFGVRNSSVGRGTAIGWTVALVVIAGVLMGFNPGADGRWNDARFWNSFSITLLIIVVSVVGAFLVGLPLALMANVNHPLKWLVRVALLLPWAMPRVFTGLTFAWMFQTNYGVVNDVLGTIGLTSVIALVADPNVMSDSGVIWLARPVPAIIAVNLAIIWKTSSFVGLILLAGLQSIDKGLYEAAIVDGANAWQRFWRITLPLLRPSIAVALIFRTLTAIQTFDTPFAMTGGGPGRTLETLGVYIYKTVNGLNIGYAAALAVALFVMSLSITIFYLRWIYADE
ncbi:MAG: sugar ABC transporter permease [Trueperaceae bacterium]|nr:sugar ABC transporter permease [Trueperaceae bacterium]